MKICGKCNKEKELTDFYYYKDKPRSWCKDCDAVNTLARQTAFKEFCVEYLGGKCEKCGYCKYIGALEFHHKDPSQKEFGISKSKLKKFDDSVRKELDKCVLLCANCHREEHNKFDMIQAGLQLELYKSQKIKRKQALEKNKSLKLLCSCGNKKSLKSTKCIKCSKKSHFSIDINIVINKIKETNFTKAGIYFGLSDNGIRKFLKKNGIDPKTLK